VNKDILRKQKNGQPNTALPVLFLMDAMNIS